MTRKQYNLADLLANAIQPFPDMPEDELQDLARSLNRPKALEFNEIRLMADGETMWDGNQRVKAMIINGRTTISDDEVRIHPEVVTVDDAWFWAGQYNMPRRHLTVDQRADVARKYRAEMRWGDAKIGKALGVSSMTIGRWLKDEPKLDAVIGLDGVMQPQTGKKGGRPKADNGPSRVDPWSGDGPVLRTIIKLARDLNEMIPDEDGDSNLPLPTVADLTTDPFNFVKLSLVELAKAIEAVLAEMAKPPKPPKPTPSKKVAKKAPAKKTPSKKAASARIMIPGAAARMFEQGE